MKAAIYSSYGPPKVLRIAEVPKPVPKNNEILIKVYASTLNRTDCGYRSAKYFITRFFTGLSKPKNPIGGSEFAGEVVEVGPNVTEFKVGDRVFGFDDVNGGGHAEYVAKPVGGAITKIPEGQSYEAMAPAGEGATYALNVIKSAGVKKGDDVMVYGASGAIGSAAAQILKDIGANVTAVCNTKNFKIVQSLGPDVVIDYEKQDFLKTTGPFDLILDAVGKRTYGEIKHLLKPKGRYYSSELGPGGQNPFLALWFGITGSRKVMFPIPKINKENIEYIARIVGKGAFKPVIDRTYPLEDIVEATKYVETGQKTGNVVIKIV